MQKAILVLCAAFALSANTASAAPIIDFRVVPCGTTGATSETIGFVTVTALPAGATLDHSCTSGFGIDGPDGTGRDDRNEIDDFEILRIDFSRPTHISGALITRFFAAEVTGELGFYSLDGGPLVPFAATGAGDFDLAIPLSLVRYIEFSAPADGFSDFSVGGLDAVAVPEPASLLLFGAAIATAGRRMRGRLRRR